MMEDYIKMPLCICKNKVLDSDEKIMLSTLLFLNEKKVKKIIVSNETFSNLLHLNVRTIMRKKAHLQELGLISIIKKRNTFNLNTVSEYVINEETVNNFFGDNLFEEKELKVI